LLIEVTPVNHINRAAESFLGSWGNRETQTPYERKEKKKFLGPGNNCGKYFWSQFETH